MVVVVAVLLLLCPVWHDEWLQLSESRSGLPTQIHGGPCKPDASVERKAFVQGVPLLLLAERFYEQWIYIRSDRRSLRLRKYATALWHIFADVIS